MGAAERIASARAEAPGRRQGLVDETRSLKSLAPAERPAKIGRVMKAFQKHVDVSDRAARPTRGRPATQRLLGCARAL